MTAYEGEITGEVCCNGRLYFTRTAIYSDSIHTIAVTDLTDFDKVTEGIKDNIIKDAAGVPYIGCSPASVSHHGRFSKVAYICPTATPAAT